MSKKIRYIIFNSVFLFLILSLLMTRWLGEPPEEPQLTHIYLVPENLTGCVWVYYNQPTAEPLKIVNEEIIFNIPESGILKTSSSIEFIPYNGHTEEVYTINPLGERVRIDTTDFHSSGYHFEHEFGIEKSWMKVDDTVYDCGNG